MHSLTVEVNNDWEYFKFPGNVTPEMVPYGDGTYELVMVVGIFISLSQVGD